VRAALLGAGESEIELLEPLEPSSGIGRFLARRGEGLHHLCFDTPDIVKTLTSLKEMRVELLDETPRPGLAGQIAFVHPRACCGVLVELATPSSANAHDLPAPLRLKRLVIGAADVRRASDLLRSHFGLEELAMNGGRARCWRSVAARCWWSGRGSRRHRGTGRALDDRGGLPRAQRRLHAGRHVGPSRHRRSHGAAGFESRRAPAHQPLLVAGRRPIRAICLLAPSAPPRIWTFSAALCTTERDSI